jgi:hypothetical protein
MSAAEQRATLPMASVATWRQGRWAGRSAALPRGIRPVSFTGAIYPVPHETEAVVSKGVPT